MPLGVRVLAKPMKYCSLARLTVSRSLCICSSGNWNELNADLTDFKRRLRLKHFFHDKNEKDNTETDGNNENEDPDETTHRYKKTSTWTPPKNLDPALDSYIHNIERDITNMQPTKISDNLTTQERDALQKLTRRTDIVIKPADKGSGTVVMDKQFYINECNQQLTDTKFYEKHDNDVTDKVTRTVTRYLEKMKQNEDIDKDTYSYLLPKDPRCSRFYILPKIHKNRQTPPGRPIVSANGHPTERISEYVSNILNPLVFKLPSFIKDTTHFHNKLSSLGNLPNNSLLVSLDVSSLYTNIPHSEGIQAAREHLNKRTTQRPPRETICDLINIILQNNNFEFDGQFFLQKHGTAMGTRMAPPYANLFMGSLEATALENAPYKPLVWWRFIDDIFLIWTHGQDKLADFITTLNHIHPTIKFTNETSSTSINFLDVTVTLNNDNSISTDLYVKPTDTHQYLLSSSAHPRHTKQSIPYSLTLRLRRICSNDTTFKKRTNELLTYLTNRGYKRKHVRNEIRKASTTTRQDSLKTKQKRHNNRTPFVVTYNPCLPQITTILKQHHHILQDTDSCKEAFPQPPILSYRRPKNLRDHLVRAKLKSDATSAPRGSYKCNSRRHCNTCSHILDRDDTVTFTNTNKTFTIKQRLDCNSTNIIYAIQCKTCTQNGNDNCQYIGQTGRRLRDRLNEHRRDIINRKTDKSGVAEHFCKPGHSVNDLQILPLLQMHNERETVRRAKEQYFIGLANTLTPNGMNRTTDR